MSMRVLRSWGDDQDAMPYERDTVQAFSKAPTRTQAVRARRFVATLNRLQHQLEQAESARDGARAALRESQARVEEYRREVERRDELLAGADADLRESQARATQAEADARRLHAALEAASNEMRAAWQMLSAINEGEPSQDRKRAAVAAGLAYTATLAALVDKEGP